MGKGTQRDDTGAASWFEKAAESQHADAQFALGVVAACGRATGGAERAILLWKDAAKRGNIRAAHNYGMALSQGWGNTGGVEAKEEAASYLRRAGTAGCIAADFELACRMMDGDMQPWVQYDTEEGIRTMEIAAKRGIKAAAIRLARHFAFQNDDKTAARWISYANAMPNAQEVFLEEGHADVQSISAVTWARGDTAVDMARAGLLMYLCAARARTLLCEKVADGRPISLLDFGKVLQAAGISVHEAGAAVSALSHEFLSVSPDQTLDDSQQRNLADLLNDEDFGLRFSGGAIVQGLYGSTTTGSRVRALADDMLRNLVQGYGHPTEAFSEFCREEHGVRVEATIVLEGFSESDCEDVWCEKACALISVLLEVGLLR